MTFKVSAALRDAMLRGESFKKAMSNCELKIFTGPQPATADSAPTGTLLCTYTDNSGSFTHEVQSYGSVQLTGGASGNVSSITVNSLEILGKTINFDGTLAITAADIVKAINDNPKNLLYDASSDGLANPTITIKARRGLGSLPNTWAVVSTTATITKVDTNFANGVSAVNGLNWGDVAGGIIAKLTSQVWSGVAANTGTAGWFRFEAAVTDPETLDSTETYYRVDGAIASSGAELNMGNTTITVSVPQVIGSFTITLPTA